jgi:proteasome accessory factor B
MSCLVVDDQQRVHTVSRKSERLVNLTIALLSTKRYLTKAEIFKNVAGYSGDAEAKDRMFERDKDDLRSLGITIELGTFDPLFEDEAGYRIKPDSYALQLRDLDTTSIALLSQAARLWREAALGDSAQSGLRKLKGLGIESDIDALVDVSTTVQSTPEQIPDLIEAITDRRAIVFEYLSPELKSEVRNLEPYRLSNSRGYWYLIGRDIDKASLRTFRVDRISSTISFKASAGSFEVDIEALDQEEHSFDLEIHTALLALRKGKAPQLRTGNQVIELDADWDQIEIEYKSEEILIQQILWHGTDVRLLAPQEMREEIIRRVEEAITLHG